MNFSPSEKLVLLPRSENDVCRGVKGRSDRRLEKSTGQTDEKKVPIRQTEIGGQRTFGEYRSDRRKIIVPVRLEVRLVGNNRRKNRGY